MNIFPIQWRTAPLDNIACLINGDRGENYPSKGAFVASGVPFINAGHLTGGDVALAGMNYISEDHYERLRSGKTRPKDILFCLRGSVGKMGVIGSIERAAIASSLVIVRADGLMCNRYIYQYLKSPLAKIESDLYNNGTAQPNLGAQSLGRFSVPIAPRQEQTRIADKLDTVLTRVDACRDRLARVAPLLKRFRQSVLAAATSGRLTEDWRSRRGSISGVSRIQLGEDQIYIPVQWEVQPLADCIDANRPLCYGVVQPGEESIEGVPLIRVQDMVHGTVDTEGLRTITREVDGEYKRSRVREGDVLVSVVGTIGRASLVPSGFHGNIARAVARISCNKSVHSGWMHAWLSVPCVQWWLTNNSKEVARKTLNLSDLVVLPVPQPTLEEQTEIVRRVETLFAFADRLEARLKAAQTAADRLTPALLAKAFRGELVPQDPNDEPAAELLKRLAASRDAAPKAKRGRRSAMTDTKS